MGHLFRAGLHVKYEDEERVTHSKALVTVTCSPAAAFLARLRWVVWEPLVGITAALGHHGLMGALLSLAALNL